MTSARRVQDLGWRKPFNTGSYPERIAIPRTRILKRREASPGRGNHRSKGQEQGIHTIDGKKQDYCVLKLIFFYKVMLLRIWALLFSHHCLAAKKHECTND